MSSWAYPLYQALGPALRILNQARGPTEPRLDTKLKAQLGPSETKFKGKLGPSETRLKAQLCLFKTKFKVHLGERDNDRRRLTVFRT